MSMLVHLAPASLERRIARSGLRGRPLRLHVDGVETQLPQSVFATPHLESFWLTHQWLRELRRWQREELVAVDFRVDSGETVLIGRTGRAHRRVSLAEAIAAARERPLGVEVVLLRDIDAREIVRIRRVR